MSKWVGESVRVVRACFSLAAKLAPCVLFLDEVSLYPPHTSEYQNSEPQAAAIQWKAWQVDMILLEVSVLGRLQTSFSLLGLCPSHPLPGRLTLAGMTSQVDAMLSRRRAEGEPDYLREVKNEFMAQWDGIRYLQGIGSCCM